MVCVHRNGTIYLWILIQMSICLATGDQSSGPNSSVNDETARVLYTSTTTTTTTQVVIDNVDVVVIPSAAVVYIKDIYPTRVSEVEIDSSSFATHSREKGHI